MFKKLKAVAVGTAAPESEKHVLLLLASLMPRASQQFYKFPKTSRMTSVFVTVI